MMPNLVFIPSKSGRLARSRVSPHLGFTLIEIMVVIGVVALIVAAMAPMVFSTLSATRLSASGETLAGQFGFAKQKAVAGNQEVEVRFFKYADPEMAGNQPLYRAVGIFTASISDNASNIEIQAEQLGEIIYLPSGVAFGESQALSPILASASFPETPDRARSISKAPAVYKAIRFQQDGATNLNADPSVCYVTLVEDRFANGQGGVPRNFFAIQIDPATGRTTTYRP
jgi:uncharacterized protein (TIGR02596 family)